MSNWTKNNAAHAYTYISLRVMDMTEANFADAETIRMSQLGHWVPGWSAEMRNEVARSRASMLNNLFIITFQASFEEDTNSAAAIAALADAFATATKTIRTLAAVADDHYDFPWRRSQCLGQRTS